MPSALSPRCVVRIARDRRQAAQRMLLFFYLVNNVSKKGKVSPVYVTYLFSRAIICKPRSVIYMGCLVYICRQNSSANGSLWYFPRPCSKICLLEIENWEKNVYQVQWNICDIRNPTVYQMNYALCTLGSSDIFIRHYIAKTGFQYFFLSISWFCFFIFFLS